MDQVERGVDFPGIWCWYHAGFQSLESDDGAEMGPAWPDWVDSTPWTVKPGSQEVAKGRILMAVAEWIVYNGSGGIAHMDHSELSYRPR